MSKKKTRASAAENTRARISRAAISEFSERGFSGARVERIAARARVNVGMLYYFFHSKKRLLGHVLREILLQRKSRASVDHESAADLLVSYFDGYAEDAQRVRLLQWEALETRLPARAASLTNFAARHRALSERVARIAALQKRGLIPGGLDPQLLYLSFVALAIYPMTYPQSVFVATGADANAEEFKRRYRAFLRGFAQQTLPSKS